MFEPNRASIFRAIRMVSNYNGAVNTSLQESATLPGEVTRNSTCCLSYYVTSCFQHIYLATSSLWGEGSLMGASSEDLTFENNLFRYMC